jgi:penicillin-binding protein 1B
VVLASMAADGSITQEQRQKALKEPDMDPAALTSGISRFPAFLSLVKRELLKEYQEEDLTDDGIRILTTFDTRVQLRVEKAVKQGTAGRKGLQAAAVVTSRDSGEIQALVSDRQAGFAGFNRALDAARPIGSLVKPAVYLTALGKNYTLASPLEDRAISLPAEKGKVWQPANYDRREHGTIPLFRALAHSYNLATVRLGMALGLDKVADTLVRLGATSTIPHYPSLLLGAVGMTPLEVTQIYQTLADDGFHTPLRAIRTVLAADGKPLKRYGLAVEQRFDPITVFLLNNALLQVVASGTGQPLAAYLPPGTAAGKTGTSDDLRDSWFAGFTGDRVAVVWVGRDDNTPMGLTGASGALPIWGRFMQEIRTQPLELVPPPNIVWARVGADGYDSDEEYWSAVTLPFIEGSAPAGTEYNMERNEGGLRQRIRSLFGW